MHKQRFSWVFDPCGDNGFDRDTQETYDLLMRQYAEIEGVTEDLKRSDQMKRIRRMNSIRNRVEEFVLSDFVYA